VWRRQDPAGWHPVGQQIRPRGGPVADRTAFEPPDSRTIHTNLVSYYGIEQIGLDGYSKRARCTALRYTKRRSCRISPNSRGDAGDERRHRHRGGLRASDMGGEETYDVGGTARAAFKSRESARLRLFTEDMEAMVRFYRNDLAYDHRGNQLQEHTAYSCARTPSTTPWRSIRSRCAKNCALRADTTLLSFGLQLAAQTTQDAIAFLKENGVTIKYLRPNYSRGIDYSPSHRPRRLRLPAYYYMNKSAGTADRGPSRSHEIDNAKWPKSVERRATPFWDEPFWGHWVEDATNGTPGAQ